MARPRLLMIDEPFLGLAPRIVDQISEIMVRINREDVAILFIEQHVERALAHRGFVLESGRTVLEGRSAELLRSPEVRKVFLGG
jgi:branched-chain amino acid transport system ATP-binding protein